MAEDSDERPGIRGSLRRTVERVAGTMGEAATELTGATAAQVIEDLQPYLEEQVVPQIIDAVTPHLVESVVPEVIDGITPDLVQRLLPQILEGLRPYLVQEYLPRLLDELRGHLADELLPELLEQFAPHLEQEVAPRLVDALVPKIRAEVVPVIMADIVEDPGLRDLVREQSFGLVQDTLEAFREKTADFDDIVEGGVRRVFGQRRRTDDESGLDLVLNTARRAPSAQASRARLAEEREHWQHMEHPPAPPGRAHTYAGLATRLLSFGLDVTLTAWVVSQGIGALLSFLASVFGELHPAVVLGMTGVGWSLVALYLALCWALVGRTFGNWLLGVRVCTGDGARPHFLRALLRGVLELFGYVGFLVTSTTSFFDDRRRTVMDMLAGTEVRYVVPKEQQDRYIRAALANQRPPTTS